MNKIFDLLKTKSILKDITNESKIKFLNPNDGVYIGFDPSAPSLHLGNYIQINILKLFQKYGFKVFAVLGGATGMIGDPSGKNSERKLLSSKQVLRNKKKIKAQIESFGIEVIDNIIFYKRMSFLSFLREVGKHIGINYMISKESVKSRLLTGLSFTEFSYQLIQGWDFKCLYSQFNIKIQVGGSDQWGNITTGIELIKKFFGENHSAIGLTTNLLLTEDGQKFGKTENNPIWLDPKLTLPYYLYQYLYNVKDDFVFYYYDWLTTNNSWDQLDKLSIKEAKQKLAYDVTSKIHGQEIAKNIKKTQSLIFNSKKLEIEDIQLLKKVLPNFIFKKTNILDVLCEIKIASSKREARELVSQNSISINNTLINDITYSLIKGTYLIKKGKRWHYLVVKL